MTHFLHSIGISPVKEPFKSLLVQGMVRGQSYKVKATGKYLKPNQVDKEKLIELESGSEVVCEWEKMSKSKYNGVDPDEMIDKYGCDTTRLMMLSVVSPKTERKWTEDDYPRIRNLISRYFLLVELAISLQKEAELLELNAKVIEQHRNKLKLQRNQQIKVNKLYHMLVYFKRTFLFI